MYDEIHAEQLKKQCAEQQDRANCPTANGLLGSTLSQAGYAEPARPGLRERVAADLRHAQRNASKENALHELTYLLDKNPEVARILDLMEVVRG